MLGLRQLLKESLTRLEPLFISASLLFILLDNLGAILQTLDVKRLINHLWLQQICPRWRHLVLTVNTSFLCIFGLVDPLLHKVAADKLKHVRVRTAQEH